jgi:2-C-methyl-D-erythritol 4-phosphate cytidylyltransferase
VTDSVWAIVLAGGSGSRFGGLKQFELIGGRRVLDWSVAAASAFCDGTVVVVPPGIDERGAVPGGTTRSGSVRAGLAAIPLDADIVVVHDAARPLASTALFERVVAAILSGGDAAIPVVAVSDTIKRVEGSNVVETLDRSSLVAVQTPQAFRARVLREAHAYGAEATDDAALVEAIGGRVVTVEGERRNLKLTSRDDVAVAQALLGPCA